MDNNEQRQSYDVNNAVAENNQAQGAQPQTADDISNRNERTPFDAEHLGEGIGIGNEHFEEDGGAELGFGETDETEDKDRDNPLRRDANGGSTSDGSNEPDFRFLKSHKGNIY